MSGDARQSSSFAAGDVLATLAAHDYLADPELATAVAVALNLGKPLLLEGDAGVGKTELAKTLAVALDRRLIRLQCYEGIDVAHALYDWNYTRQMIHLRALEGAHALSSEAVDELFGPKFLLRRPLLDAIDHDDALPPVLLIDEIDRADDEFEAFLLELLSDFQVTIPEIGTLRARARPIVLLTSNRTRDLHDALKRRCLYHWLAHPSLEREVEILTLRVPGVPAQLALEAARFVAQMRELGLAKSPGVAEAIDWVMALVSLGEDTLEPAAVDATLGALVKHADDLVGVREHGVEALVGGRAPAAGVIADHVVRFGRSLRPLGFDVGVGQLEDALRALSAVDVADRSEVERAWRCCFCTEPAQLPVFDAAFDAFWSAAQATRVPTDEPEGDPVTVGSVGIGRLGSDGDGDVTDHIGAGAAAAEGLLLRDFAEYDAAEDERVRRLIERLGRTRPTRRSLRLVRASSGTHLDHRRTVQRALRHHGDPLERAWRTRRVVPRRTVFFLDVSGSMAAYARPMLLFAQAARSVDRAVEVFAFGTRPARLTDPRSAELPDWAGGTRIGESLERFHERWGARGLTRGAVVVIASDGWETGDVEPLRRGMERLHRSAQRVIWVTPGAGDPEYEPLTRGMQAALPSIDLLLPGHNLAALEALAVAFEAR